MLYKLKISLLFFIASCVGVFAQNSDKSSFEKYYKNSKELNKLSLFSESIDELNLAIELAEKNNWEEEYLKASVFMGEMMRRTADHKKGLEILQKLTNSQKYLQLHVQKLGRIAALYAEGGNDVAQSPKDSLVKYLKIALKIAKDNNFEEEEASLCNELGFFKLHNENYKVAKPYLLRSAAIFKKLKDNNNYVVVMSHLLFVTLAEEKLNEADKIINELLGLVKNKQWFGTEQTLYRNIAHRYFVENDSINFNKWKLKEAEAAYKLLTRRSNNEMSYYRVKYDTEKFKNDAEIAKQDLYEETFLLKQQQKQNKMLWVFLCTFLLLTGIVIWLFIKQKKLANHLDISNKNFQLLLIESNHRIKNNLQMILSMVNFSSDELSKSEKKALNNISSKIQIISTLHKHLYIDIKSEYVSLPLYFEEIIRLYTIIKPGVLQVESEIYPLKIKSERIVYFGLILNELLANTIEHNVSEIKKIHLTVKKTDNYYVFEYCDHSIHLETAENGQGGILLNQLVNRVKGANYKLDKKTGTYKFHFKNVD